MYLPLINFQMFLAVFQPTVHGEIYSQCLHMAVVWHSRILLVDYNSVIGPWEMWQ